MLYFLPRPPNEIYIIYSYPAVKKTCCLQFPTLYFVCVFVKPPLEYDIQLGNLLLHQSCRGRVEVGSLPTKKRRINLCVYVDYTIQKRVMAVTAKHIDRFKRVLCWKMMKCKIP